MKLEDSALQNKIEQMLAPSAVQSRANEAIEASPTMKYNMYEDSNFLQDKKNLANYNLLLEENKRQQRLKVMKHIERFADVSKV
jgi:hypothetical protein